MVLTFFIVMFILLMHFLWMHIDILVGKGLSMGVIIELVMYAMATLIPMGLPLATLLASIMTMGNLGENNELLALKAAGVSLPRIIKPLMVLMVVICIGSFFVINNLTPFAWNKMSLLLSDISKQKQEIKFQDGIFFNGIPNMSIRVVHQDRTTNRLDEVLIYNNAKNDKMQTTVADSGYIRISDDRQFLKVTLFNGQIYEKNRDYQWYTKDTLTHHMFSRQDMLIPLSGFALERSDMDAFNSKSQSKTLSELTGIIDSLKFAQDSVITKFSNQIVRNYLFRRLSKYPDLDSVPVLSTKKFIANSIDTMGIDARNAVFVAATGWANDAKNYVNSESEFARYTSSLLYLAEIEYQRKVVLPFSIMIFFLIGAPLGAIIRKGGIGMPIVVSVIFFVIYYIITIIGEKFVKDGALPAYVGVWLSSMILFPVAIFLTYKSTNDSALFNVDSYIAKYKRVINFFRTIITKVKFKI